MIEVYHIKCPLRYKTPAKSKEILFDIQMSPTAELVSNVWADFYEGLNYQLVATVDTDELEQAFDWTNHREFSWTLNEGVHPVGLGQRSTSVGDLMKHNDKSYVVKNIGFGEV